MAASITFLEEHRATRRPEIVSVERSVLDELRAELAVSRAERVVFARRVCGRMRHALFAHVKERPGDVELHLTEVLRLALQEEHRAIAAVAPEPEPIRAVA